MLTYLTLAQLIYLCLLCFAASLAGFAGATVSVILLASSRSTVGAVSGTVIAVLGLTWVFIFG